MNASSPDYLIAAEPGADQGKSLADYLSVLRRRKGLLLIVFLLLFAVAAIVALTLPAVYRSTATILIKEQEIPQEFVRSTVTSFADERIQVISQQVMTRATLLDLVDKYTLYGTARQRETSEEIIARMRRDIKLTPISADVTDRRSGSAVKSTIAFTLSYDSEVAANAQKIASELTTLYLNENVKNRQQKAAETTSFLDEELARVSEYISEVEQRLADFKRRNQGSTPDLSMSNQFNSERIATELQRLDREMVFLQDRKIQLESQLADARPSIPIAGVSGTAALEPEDRLRLLQTQLSSLTGTYSDSHPDIKRLKREIANLRSETGLTPEAADRGDKLDQFRVQLAELRRKYSDDHPDVVALRRAYTALDQAVKASESDSAAADGRRVRKPDNPVYIQLKAQIETTGSQIDVMRAERKTLQVRLQEFDLRLSQTPGVEREFLELARDLDSSRARFREMREKQMQAQVAEQLERGRKAERFTIIEPPILPEKPYRPNRQLILLMGLVLALGGSIAAVALRESLDAAVHSPKDIVRILQVPVLSILPQLPSPLATRRRKLMLRAGLLIGLIGLTLVVTLLHYFYMPVDVAWYGVLRRLSN